MLPRRSPITVVGRSSVSRLPLHANTFLTDFYSLSAAVYNLNFSLN